MLTLLRRLVDNTIPESIVSRFRRHRWDLFLSVCRPSPDGTLLDVGGTAQDTFSQWWDGPTVRVNLFPPGTRNPHDHAVVADARALPFRDRAFEVAFSNSLIEHVGSWEHQRSVASEIARVAARFFVQTPDKYTLLEPHYLIPLFQFFPRRVQRALHCRFAWGWVRRDQFEEIRLLSARDLKRLFPDAEILRERVLGLPKSCYAVRSGGGKSSV